VFERRTLFNANCHVRASLTHFHFELVKKTYNTTQFIANLNSAYLHGRGHPNGIIYVQITVRRSRPAAPLITEQQTLSENSGEIRELFSYSAVCVVISRKLCFSNPNCLFPLEILIYFHPDDVILIAVYLSSGKCNDNSSYARSMMKQWQLNCVNPLVHQVDRALQLP
jgi:hypothetical protein